MRRLLAICTIAICATILAQPSEAGRWWNTQTGVMHHVGGSTRHQAADGWVRLTPEQYAPVAAVQQEYIKPGALPSEMDAGEKAAVDLSASRRAAKIALYEACGERLVRQATLAEMSGAGKSTTTVEARIAVLETAITTALGDLP